ncbi:MAG TPA: hypothetical protein VFF72_09910 [Caldimonas sp.]|nr:hypothetical protein [Caldimonas sp.]
MMKALLALAGTACLAAMPVAAEANCFFVYSAQNQLVYRSTISPVDLSRPISDGMRGRFAGDHLTMIPDETNCPDLLVGGESQVFASFGFPSAGRSVSAIDASPLFRGLDSPGGGASTTYDGAAVTPAGGSTGRAPRRGRSGAAAGR